MSDTPDNVYPSNTRRPLVIVLAVLLCIAISGAIYMYWQSSSGLIVDSAASITCDKTVTHPKNYDISNDLGPAPKTKNSIGYSEAPSYSKGRGIWVYKGKAIDNKQIDNLLKEKVPVVELYYDYTCNFCNDLEAKHEEELRKLPREGKAIFVYHPVITHNGPLSAPANEVAAWVAAHYPDKFLAFQQALISKTSTYFTSSSLNQLQNTAKSYQKSNGDVDETKLCSAAKNGDSKVEALYYYLNPIKTIDQALKTAGIDPAKVPIPKNAVYSMASSQKFGERNNQEISTPMLYVNGKRLTNNIFNNPESITQALNDKH